MHQHCLPELPIGGRNSAFSTRPPGAPPRQQGSPREQPRPAADPNREELISRIDRLEPGSSIDRVGALGALGHYGTGVDARLLTLFPDLLDDAGHRATRVAVETGHGYSTKISARLPGPQYRDEIYLAGFAAPESGTAIRRRSSLIVPGGLPVTERVTRDASRPPDCGALRVLRLMVGGCFHKEGMWAVDAVVCRW